MRPRPGQAYLFAVIDAPRAKGGADIPGKDYFYDRDRLAPFAVLISVTLAYGRIKLIIEWGGDFAE
jgi:hypothetical protein